MPDGTDAQLIKESFAQVEPVADQVAAHLYAQLFVERPELRDMFPVIMNVQRERLVAALTRIVQGMAHPETLSEYLQQLGRDHRRFGVRPEHYSALGDALVASLREYSWGHWTPRVEQAWRAAYDKATAVMIAAAARSARHTPDFWTAEVLAHDRRTPDIAVVTVRPGEKLEFTPGQYVSVETPRWPRMWRPYSMANTPRSDGTLEFHVSAVPGGWVSRGLVHHGRVGDRWRLGHPMGSFQVDRASTRAILCVAAGTGLAPVKALIEDLARRNEERPVRVFVGARFQEDLYDLPAMVRLTEEFSWLNVTPVVCDDPGYLGECGQLSEVVARQGPWTDHDVLLSGWTEQIRPTAARLRELDVPAPRIRVHTFDP